MTDHRPTSEYCIYAIKDSRNLDEVYESGGFGGFTENSKWVTGQHLLEDTQSKNQKLLVIFSAAERATGLLYYAILTQININDGDPKNPLTTYHFTSLTPIKDAPPKSSLRLRDEAGQKFLSDSYIRSYALCFTPDFLKGL
ncbi:MAG: hypothetical protein F9K46_02415 [Anaerolineae bacterium]|nr:MAG: hypothetical protein F9K46_02415 [Anaerolineae bacterium]